ncbi:MAG TPA: hypothetical protein VM658_03305 [bacterium]|nr:hypothetical protein [bacterium]
MNPSDPPFIFSIHSLVRGRVRGPAALLGPVARELQFFRDDAGPREEALDLDIILTELGKSGGADTPVGPGNGDNSVPATQWEGRHLIARWRAALGPAGGATRELRFRGNWASRFIVSKWIVEPAVRVVMESKGAAMLHGAALSDGGRAVLVAGAGGAGKTTWALNWIAAGNPYLSDDFTVVKNGQALPYVTPLRLGLMNLMMGDRLSRLPVAAKAEITLRTVVRRASLGRLKLYYKAMPQAAAPGMRISGESRITGAIWIGRGLQTRGTDRNSAKKISGDEMAARMTEVDRAEMHGFGGDAGGEGGALSDDFWSAHESRLADALMGKPCFYLPGRCLPPAAAVSSVAALMDWAEKMATGGR